MVPLGETANVAPFEPLESVGTDLSPGQRGKRALISAGELDTDVRGLIPLVPNCRIVGASSDISVVHIDDDSETYMVGDTLSFKLSYSALLRLMNGRYIPKVIRYDSGRSTTIPSNNVQTSLPRVDNLSKINQPSDAPPLTDNQEQP
jgi:hypothetical protein